MKQNIERQSDFVIQTLLQWIKAVRTYVINVFHDKKTTQVCEDEKNKKKKNKSNMV